MLKVLLSLADQLQRGNFPDMPLADQWIHLPSLVTTLEPFAAAVQFLEGDSYITSSFVLPKFYFLRDKLASQDPTKESGFQMRFKQALLEQLIH